MMRNLIPTLLLAFFSLAGLYSQVNSFDTIYTKSITTESLRKHVYILASDSLEGRLTGSEGQKKAARYIANNFKQIGITPYNDSCFFQPLELWKSNYNNCKIFHKEKEYVNYKDMIYMGRAQLADTKADCIFIGDGSDKTINQLNFKNKIACALVGNLNEFFIITDKTKDLDALALMICSTDTSGQFYSFSKRIKEIQRHRGITDNKPKFNNSGPKIFIVQPYITEQLFNKSVDELNNYKTLKKLKKLPQPELTLNCSIDIEKIKTENVIAYIPGTAKDNETLVVSAHYDHLGKTDEDIYPGADDNASGTAALIELAKAFSEFTDSLYKNIVFIATTAEEEGLMGAHYFVNHVQEDSFNIKANINIDMIGRKDSLHKENYIYTIGNYHYPEFDSILHIANKFGHPLHIQYEYNDRSGFGNMINLSDHYAFHKNSIPIIAFFSGIHEDYHKSTDTPDKIDYPEMVKRVKLIFRTAYMAAQKTALND